MRIYTHTHTYTYTQKNKHTLTYTYPPHTLKHTYLHTHTHATPHTHLSSGLRLKEYTDCISAEGQPLNECPGYDTKQYGGEVPVMLEL